MSMPISMAHAGRRPDPFTTCFVLLFRVAPVRSWHSDCESLSTACVESVHKCSMRRRNRRFHASINQALIEKALLIASLSWFYGDANRQRSFYSPVVRCHRGLT